MSEENSVNLKKGVSFKFEDMGNQINLKSKPFSGLEEVFLNGELISSKKSFSKNSSASFEIGKDVYSLDLRIVSMLKGPIICTLNKNGNPHKKKQIVFKHSEGKGELNNGSFLKYTLFALLGILIVVVKIYWNLPFESFYYLLGAVFITYFVYEYLNQEDPIFLMEEVEIE